MVSLFYHFSDHIHGRPRSDISLPIQLLIPLVQLFSLEVLFHPVWLLCLVRLFHLQGDCLTLPVGRQPLSLQRRTFLAKAAVWPSALATITAPALSVSFSATVVTVRKIRFASPLSLHHRVSYTHHCLNIFMGLNPKLLSGLDHVPRPGPHDATQQPRHGSSLLEDQG